MSLSPNIFIIVIDTLRKDFADMYLRDILVKKFNFIAYNNAIAPAPWTTPSHASLFTGLYPIFHGAHETRKKKDYDVKLSSTFRFRLLSHILSSMGYETYLLSANMHVTPYFGFSGFHYFYDTFVGKYISLMNLDDRLKVKELLNKFKCKSKYDVLKAYIVSRQIRLLLKNLIDRYLFKHLKIYKNKYWPLDKGVQKTIRYLTRKVLWHENKPKFIFINLMETHEPYTLDDHPEEISRLNFRTGYLDPKVVFTWRQKYLEETVYIGHNLIKLLKIIRENIAYENSLIIITSDHGQLLGEHGRIRHGTFLYDELLRIPLFIKYPNNIDHIEAINDLSECCISLTNLYYFILDMARGNTKSALNKLCSETCFAESYGIEIPYDMPSNPIERKNIENLEKYRIAIYYRGVKIVYNINDKRIDEITMYKPISLLDQELINIIKKKVIRFITLGKAVGMVKHRIKR